MFAWCPSQQVVERAQRATESWANLNHEFVGKGGPAPEELPRPGALCIAFAICTCPKLYHIQARFRVVFVNPMDFMMPSLRLLAQTSTIPTVNQQQQNK